MNINKISINENRISYKQKIKLPLISKYFGKSAKNKVEKQPFIITEKIQKFSKKVSDIIISILDTF